ncbi:MAG TPA: hydroxysqualene dehydroxylase HpnE [Ignavibacteria bacterium]|jgi:zeta-carotene desaturase
MKNTVTVIGGGLAGLSAAVFLTKEGFKVNLYEASPKLGGRAYSFFDKSIGDYVDNGQHIFASWYKNTFEYLKIIGSYDKLYFQKQLEVIFTNLKAQNYILKASKLPPPLHLLGGLMNFKAIKLVDRLAAIRLINNLKNKKISDEMLTEMNTDELFKKTKQTKRLLESFWKPLIIAVFNADPEDTSAYMFSEIIKTGFIEKGGSNLVFPDVFLSELLVNPALKYLETKRANIKAGKKINRLNIKNHELTSIIAEDKEEITSNYYVSAIPFYDVKNLFGSNAILGEKDGLFPSPIVNIHFKFEKDISSIFNNRFSGILGANIQWVFRVKNDQLCLVISSAKKITEMDKESIISLCKNELYKCFPALSEYKITGTRVIKEMRATFMPDKNSLKLRPDCKTKIENFFLAGDWTNTGLPATIEGSVKSGKICTNEIIKHSKSL